MQVTQNHDKVLVVCTETELLHLMACLVWCLDDPEDDGTAELLEKYLTELHKGLKEEDKPCD